MNVGIAGAGVLGRLLAWRLSRLGHAVTVFDPALGPQPPLTGHTAGLMAGQPSAGATHAAGFTAAGMLSPLAELDNAGAEVARLGWRSLALWQQVAEQLGQPQLLRREGSLMLAHGSDLGAARRVLSRLQAGADIASPQPLDRAALQALEPAVTPGLQAWLLPGEGQLLPREMLAALWAGTAHARWCWGASAIEVRPGRISLVDGSSHDFDLAIDTRGLGAKDAPTPVDSQAWTPQLRGVRGEVIWLHAPGLQLTRPLRLLHPRHRVYLVPRPGDIVVAGASEVESEDRSPVSLRSAVELMAAAHSVIPELAEARIVHMEVNLRPALPDHLPRTQIEPGLLRINGLFRHGWLLAPALVQDALATLGLEDRRHEH